MRKEVSNPSNRKLQLQELMILDEFRKLCRKHDLHYYLTAGTLLGAVRHNGFIPWDDDTDIAMPRKDFDSLAALCHSDLSEGYFYQDFHIDSNCPFFFAKIRKNGTEVCEPVLKDVPIHQGIYIDIFPLDPCPKRAGAAKIYFKVIQLLTCSITAKISRYFICGYKKWYMKLLFHLFKRFPLRVLFSLRDIIRKTVSRWCSGERLCTVGGAHGYPYETYEAAWFRESVLLPFEGDRYPAPAGWHDLLTNMYGDYMTPPDITDRQGHFEDQ